jgi:hypothetical protein
VVLEGISSRLLIFVCANTPVIDVLCQTDEVSCHLLVIRLIVSFVAKIPSKLLSNLKASNLFL